MKAMVLEAPRAAEEKPLELRQMAPPAPGPDQVRVKIEACGVCRTDLHIVEGELPPHKQPVVPGHQVVGRVDQIGAGVEAFQPGQRVGLAWLGRSCGRCRYCKQGKENLCNNATFTGYDVDGGFAEYAVADAAFAYKVPEGLPADQVAPLLCAGIIGYRAMKLADVERGKCVGMFGFGASAHVALQVARYWDCPVYVFTRGQTHRQVARQLGAAWVGSAGDDPPEKLNSAIMFAPAGELVPRALELLDRGGTLSLAGIYMSDVPAMQYEKHLYYERTIRSVTAATRQDGQELLDLADRIPIRTQVETFELEQANEVLIKLKHSQLKASGVLRVA